ncbi:conserved hypothetical protein [Vibrio chagasii]|nr:conserved hypothetical protein [Vibrio chagasii]CAH7276261.1 conserved hypothetical protein [Vibrio chagasii]
MYVEGYLKSGQKLTASASGTNVYLASGKQVQVICKPSEHVYILRRGDQVRLPEGLTFDAVEVTNLGPDEDIELVCIDGRFYPTIDGSSLNMVADLTVENLDVRFDGRQPVALPPTQQVIAKLKDFPDVLPVQVENPVQAPEVQKVNVVAERTPSLRFVAHETMTQSGTITGNVKRKELILKASDENTDTIWMGGYADKGYGLRPGEGFVLSNGASVEVLIPTNCKLFISETTA